MKLKRKVRKFVKSMEKTVDLYGRLFMTTNSRM